MASLVRAFVFATGALLATHSATDVLADPVISTHPRLLFEAAGRVRLLAKKNANDPSWLALKARADTLASYTIHPYTFATSSDAPAGTIYYTYQGEGWLAAALPLAFAYQMTADTTYSTGLFTSPVRAVGDQNSDRRKIARSRPVMSSCDDWNGPANALTTACGGLG